MRRKLERMIEMITEVGLGGYHPASPFTRFQDLSLPLDPTFSPNFLLFFKKNGLNTQGKHPLPFCFCPFFV